MSDTECYQRIFARFGFHLPVEYQRLQERGFLTLDRPAASISAIPGDGYLWLNDMEWYRLEDIAAFEFPEYCSPHLPSLVPFAFNGAGDYWCWQADKTDDLETRVLLCPHDYQLATIYASSFPAALYRQALEYSHGYVGTQFASFAEGRAFLQRWSRDLELIFPIGWCRVLSKLATHPLVEWSDRLGHHTSLLSPDGLKLVEDRDLRFDEMDLEIPWMNLPNGLQA